MSVICGVIKDNIGAISSDSLISSSNFTTSEKFYKTKGKFIPFQENYIGVVGWVATQNILQHLFANNPDLNNFKSTEEIFETIIKIHPILKEKYFINSNPKSTEGFENSNFHLLILNPHGLFEVGGLRSVTSYTMFWSIGSGEEFALGAMNATYNLDYSAKEIAEIGVTAASSFSDGCELPCFTKTIQINRRH